MKKEGPKLIKLKMKKGTLQQIPMESRGLLGNILRSYLKINWKIEKKCINF
jgi:hypothetical protein